MSPAQATARSGSSRGRRSFARVERHRSSDGDADNVRVDSKAAAASSSATAKAPSRSIDAGDPGRRSPSSRPRRPIPRAFSSTPPIRQLHLRQRARRRVRIAVVDGARQAPRLASLAKPPGSAEPIFAMALDQRPGAGRPAWRSASPRELGMFSSVPPQVLWPPSRSFRPAATPMTSSSIRRGDRIYVSCGEGFVDVLAAYGNSYRQAAHIATAPGARTSLFVSELDRLLLAVPARSEAAAAIWIFRPSP